MQSYLYEVETHCANTCTCSLSRLSYPLKTWVKLHDFKISARFSSLNILSHSHRLKEFFKLRETTSVFLMIFSGNITTSINIITNYFKHFSGFLCAYLPQASSIQDVFYNLSMSLFDWHLNFTIIYLNSTIMFHVKPDINSLSSMVSALKLCLRKSFLLQKTILSYNIPEKSRTVWAQWQIQVRSHGDSFSRTSYTWQ